MSKIEVNQIDVQCGSTLTVGSSGKTVQLATGASQTGFGRTGTVDWCTTAKTTPFTATSGDGFFVNTASGTITVTLPASPSAGDIVAFKDYSNSWACNAVTLNNNCSKINGVCGNATLDTIDQSVTLVYVDGTRGWRTVNDSTSSVSGTGFISATGGTVLTCGNFKTHVFTGDGTFVVSGGGGPAAVVDYFVVAGGGAGGGNCTSGSGSGGGGAGGFRLSNSPVSGIPAPTMSPLAAPNSPTPGALPVSIQSYPVAVGGGGTSLGPTTGARPAYQAGPNGSNSTFSTITSAGGGGGSGGCKCTVASQAGNGGSGGGSGYNGLASCTGLGNVPPTSPAQGNNGGNSSHGPDFAAAGGGGASQAGSGAPGTNTGGAGGGGSFIADAFFGPTAPSYGASSPTPNTRAFSGGGGGSGGRTSGSPVTGGAGGFGGGGAGGSSSPGAGTDGTVNTGGGGGGAAGPAASGGGGKGFVAIRYKFQ